MPAPAVPPVEVYSCSITDGIPKAVPPSGITVTAFDLALFLISTACLPPLRVYSTLCLCWRTGERVCLSRGLGVLSGVMTVGVPELWQILPE